VGEAASAGDVLARLGTVGTGPPDPTLAPEHLLLVEPGLGGEIRLNPDDRLDRALGLLRGLEELVGSEHVAVIAHGHGRHALPLDLGDQFAVLRRAVQHRILGVDVQMDEVFAGT
jgi:hypothetical protein